MVTNVLVRAMSAAGQVKQFFIFCPFRISNGTAIKDVGRTFVIVMQFRRKFSQRLFLTDYIKTQYEIN